MKTLRFTRAAVADLDAIWDYTAEHWSLDQADRYTDAIRDACQELAAGTVQDRLVDVRAGYRKLRTGSHVIYHRDQGEALEVVRILHMRQDVAQHL